jgi:DNA-binding FrmR family transcriptional regulator
MVGDVEIDELDAEALAAARVRLRKVEGQIRAVQRMMDEGRDCQDVLRLIGAATKALRRAGLRLAITGLEQCVADDAHAHDTTTFEQAVLELS